MTRLAVAVLALIAVLALAAPAVAAPWAQFRNDAAGDSQSTTVGAQNALQVPHFPINLPPRNLGLNYLPPGNVVVTNSNIIVVADGFTVSAYNEAGRQLWAQNLNPDNNTQGLSFVTRPALSASGATIYVMLSEQDPGGNNDPSILQALATANGSTRWTATVGNTQPSAYTTVDSSGNVYVATATISDGDEVSGSSVQAFSSGGVPLWTTALPGGEAIGGVVVDSSGNVYAASTGSFGPGGGPPAVTSIASSTGAVQWSTSLGTSNATGISGPPVVTSTYGLLYVSTTSPATGGQVVALATTDGANLGPIGTTAIEGGAALSGSGNFIGPSASNAAVAQTTNGSTTPLWIRGGPPSGEGSFLGIPSPAIGADGTVYISATGYLLAANGGTGATAWIFRASNFTFGSPAIGPDGAVWSVIRPAVTGTGQSSGGPQLIGFAGPP